MKKVTGDGCGLYLQPAKRMWLVTGEKFRTAIWRWTLRTLRTIVWAADEWILKQEQAIRDETEKPESQIAGYLAAVDPKASAARERIVRKARASKPKMPRLIYQHGNWVRQ